MAKRVIFMMVNGERAQRMKYAARGYRRRIPASNKMGKGRKRF